ncbi:MAG: alpha-glucan family phosphorylase [Betaproteobacteria bacterium]|nr:alpha-glucan family phosphorylase [Betaproteobacteria bacterium]
MPGTPFPLDVIPQIPARLKRLEELANNLWYAWDRPTRTLFARLHPHLWQAVGHSPKAFLKRIDQHRLNEAAADPVFLGAYNRVMSAFDTYLKEPIRTDSASRPGSHDLIAYFCAEFGFHESLPIYSGGLGILAGDHCKTASDLRLPFIGVGMLYRQGYFLQSIDSDGRQDATYNDSDFDDLPVAPVLHDDRSELRLRVELPGRTVTVKVWQARVGHVVLYLLDTDLEENTPHDRDIGHRLYGGDRSTRIEQEIVLGVGGARALQVLGLAPTCWHINEGHAAFLILERIRALRAQGLDFATAMEAVASNTVFTTHTPVPAGHDHFAEDMIRHYFDHWCREVDIDHDQLMAMGRTPSDRDFNMTALAIRNSRFQNGVSRIHGEVSSRICAELWPQIEDDENPIDYVTNGVHAPTFMSDMWNEVFDRLVGPGWSQRICDQACWEQVRHIPDQLYWSVRQSLKSQMLHLVRDRVSAQHARNHGSEAHLDRLFRYADPENPNVLTIGFARRFATYKRATLIFENLDWLRQITSDPQRPVLFIFAGKAHPADQPGQEFIRWISRVARQPEFEGKILMVEGYDLRLARRLVAGVDVWLNNPIYPLEASGTSGMKASMNGVLNLSVLDGWWGEGYEPGNGNGWAIKPASSTLDQSLRNQEESRTLYEILQDHVIPMYYNRGPMGLSPGWVAMSKRAITTIVPRFNSARMVGEYLEKFYLPAMRHWRRCSSEGFAGARDLAVWKQRVRHSWARVAMRRLDTPKRRLAFGESLHLEVAVSLDGLTPQDVTVELLVGRPGGSRPHKAQSYNLCHERVLETGEHLYGLVLSPDQCGKVEYRVRIFPSHPLLTHRFEMGLMAWL